MRVAIVRYGRGASDGEGEGLRDSPDASKRVCAGEGLRDSAGALERVGDSFRLFDDDLGDDKGMERFDDTAAAIFPPVQLTVATVVKRFALSTCRFLAWATRIIAGNQTKQGILRYDGNHKASAICSTNQLPILLPICGEWRSVNRPRTT